MHFLIIFINLKIEKGGPAAGHFLDGLDGRINSFIYRIGDSMLQVSQNITQVFMKHPSHLLDEIKPGRPPLCSPPSIPLSPTSQKAS